MSSQATTQSVFRSRSRSLSKRGRKSRSPSASPVRWGVQRPLRRPGLTSKNAVHHFTRVTTTNPKTSLEAVTTNYWYLNNRDTNQIAYGGTTPAVFGNQISIYFDLLSVHMDLYSDAGALLQQTEYGLPSVAEFVALYEEFKIDWVQIDCFSSFENSFAAGSVANVPQNSTLLYYVKDYNDGNSSSLTSIMQQQDVQIWQPSIGNEGTYHRQIRIKPKTNFTVANTSGGAAGTAQVPFLTWLQTDTSQTIPHFGVKMAASNFFPTGTTTNSATAYLGFSFTYHLSMRNTK